MDLSFPSQPRTDDECNTVLLELLGVPDWRGVYVLGCFAKHVTVYSQQTRALNLIDALVKRGGVTKHSSLAVIGGGVAGMTAAAAAAVRGLARVAVFEEDDAVMRIQRSSSERFLHPHIYDWPKTAEIGTDAGLPLMNWTAQDASLVVDQLEEQWSQVRKAVGDRLEDPRTSCHNIRLVPRAGGGATVQVKSEEPQPFDVVILAVGFGSDSREPTRGYWANVGLEAKDQEHPGEHWVVSGFGDGALTDLMRLCIRDFRHGTVLSAVKDALGHDTAKQIGQQLIDTDLKLKDSPAERAAAYRGIATTVAAALKGNKKLERRNISKISLNCSEEQLFSPKASILNRLIAGYLLVEDRFQLLPGQLLSVDGSDGGYTLTLKSEDAVSSLKAERLILRHGPHSGKQPVKPGEKPKRIIEENFPDIWKNTAELRKRWDSAQQHEDWTRLRLFDPANFKIDADHSSHLRASFGGGVGCVVITGGGVFAAPSLTQRVQFALTHFAKQYESFATKRGKIDTVPVMISNLDAFSSPAQFERTVRALCETDLAIFDLTGWDPAVMLLLGIRAAVRRGVTIPITQEKTKNKRLPFNIGSVNPIQMSPGLSKENTWESLTSAFQSGLLALETQPNSYLDLPVFDAVRKLGDEFKPRRPEEQVLILRWFDARYERPFEEVVDNYTIQEFGNNTNIITIVDSRSPQLVEQRLYAEIRRTQLCIADWTAWRPNVFFELGVRLAVNPVDPVHIYCTEQPDGWKAGWPSTGGASAERLRAFFAPVEFTMSKPEELGKRLSDFRTDPTASNARGRLSPGRIYKIASESVEWRNEAGGRSIPELLSKHAQALDGAAVAEDAVSPVLYDSFTNSARDAAIESLLAAWYYVLARNAPVNSEAPKGIEANAAQAKLLMGIGRELSARMRKSRNSEYVAMRTAIVKQLDSLEDAHG